jgi:hypothetical protein
MYIGASGEFVNPDYKSRVIKVQIANPHQARAVHMRHERALLSDLLETDEANFDLQIQG